MIGYSDEDLLPISALQHLVFCERQCALIHIEQLWSENRHTAEGRVMHEKVHSETQETRSSVKTEYGMPLRSLRLGLIGKSDVVEYHAAGVLGEKSRTPFPIEYKRGKPKANDCDKVQLCAQALCLEEMLQLYIPSGALYYGKTKRRLEVTFDSQLRAKTAMYAARLHDLIEAGITPAPIWGSKCAKCSLMDLCLPKLGDPKVSVEAYLQERIKEP